MFVVFSAGIVTYTRLQDGRSTKGGCAWAGSCNGGGLWLLHTSMKPDCITEKNEFANPCNSTMYIVCRKMHLL